MNPARLDGRPVRVAIDTIRINARSPIEARRLADRLPSALSRAFAHAAHRGEPLVSDRQSPADNVATQIVKAVVARLEAMR